MASPRQAFEIGTDTFRRIWTHPANRGRRGRRLARWLGWQAWERVVRLPVTVRLAGGLRIRCHPHDPIASAVVYFGLADWREMDLARRYPRAGETFLDVGANIGVYSLLAVSTPGVEAHAFEPGAVASTRLVENIRLNSASGRVEVDRRAVGSERGSVAMTSDLYAMNRVVTAPDASPAGTTTVEMTTLDEWGAENPDRRVGLVKVDVEGHEIEVLEGGRELLRRERPVLIVEVNDPDRLGATLAELGYTPFVHDVERHTVSESPLPRVTSSNVTAAADLEVVRARLA
jgi:FkbM family methyltransferase